MTTPHTATDQITCPWCGYTWEPSDYWIGLMGYGAITKICQKCRKDYEIEMHTVRTFTASKVEEG